MGTDGLGVGAEKTSSARGFKMTIFCPSKEATDELWHGPRTGREGAVAIFGADEVRSSSADGRGKQLTIGLQATDISLLSGRLKSILSVPTNSPASFPIYVDLPGVPASSRVKTRVSRVLSMFDHLVPTVAGQGDFEEVATVLAGQKGRPIHSAATRVERLRSIKSPAEIKVMRKAADISAAAHSKVCLALQELILITDVPDVAGHAIRPANVGIGSHRTLPRRPLPIPHLARQLPSTRLCPRLCLWCIRPYDPLHQEQPAAAFW
jgi:Xaa-Pro aminopeptidase